MRPRGPPGGRPVGAAPPPPRPAPGGPRRGAPPPGGGGGGGPPGRDRHPRLPRPPPSWASAPSPSTRTRTASPSTASRPTRPTGRASRASRSAPTSTSRGSSRGARRRVDAIHPGYGFLSENPELRRACCARPASSSSARRPRSCWSTSATRSRPARSPSRPACRSCRAATPCRRPRRGPRLAEQLGYPVIVKAAMGRRRRGMRVVQRPSSSTRRWSQAGARGRRRSAPDEVFLERLVERARHIEVQLLGDRHGNLVHLFERDCSVQRRHQKVVEIAPRPDLDPPIRDAICDAACAGRPRGALRQRRHRRVPARRRHRRVLLHRGQPAHPGRAHRHRGGDRHRHREGQILIARRGRRSARRDRPAGSGADPPPRLAIQCRVTTEDPANNFIPDYGRITAYRSASGLGIRLDGGHGLRRGGHHAVLRLAAGEGHGLGAFHDEAPPDGPGAARVPHPRREDEHPLPRSTWSPTRVPRGRLHDPLHRRDARSCSSSPRRDRATKLLTYIGDVIVNGNPRGRRAAGSRRIPADCPPSPRSRRADAAAGTRDRFFASSAPRASRRGCASRSRLLLTDTTFRDAHQSLLATRMRTYDMLRSPVPTRPPPAGCSRWRCGAGRPSTSPCASWRGSPWERLAQLREASPTSSSRCCCGRQRRRLHELPGQRRARLRQAGAAEAGIDLFRIFDALNWLPNMRVAIDAVRSRHAAARRPSATRATSSTRSAPSTT